MDKELDPSVSAVCALGRSRLFTSAVILTAVSAVYKLVMYASSNAVMLIAMIPVLIETAALIKLRFDFRKFTYVLPPHGSITALFATEVAVGAILTLGLLADGFIILSMTPEQFSAYEGAFDTEVIRDMVNSIVEAVYDFPSEYEYLKVLGFVILFVMALVLLYYLCVALGIWRVRESFKKGIPETKIPVLLGVILAVCAFALIPRLFTVISQPLTAVSYVIDIAVSGVFAVCVFKYNKAVDAI